MKYRAAFGHQITLIVFGAFLLLIPVMLNGFPFLFQDSADYLIFTPRLFRSPFYGLFIFFFHMNRFIWLPVVAQALIASHLIYLMLKIHAPGSKSSHFTALITFLALAT